MQLRLLYVRDKDNETMSFTLKQRTGENISLI